MTGDQVSVAYASAISFYPEQIVTTSGVKKEEHDKALERIKELEADKEFLDRANRMNWGRLIEANGKIRDLEEHNKWIIGLAKTYEQIAEYNMDNWQDEYGWTAHIFDPLDSNPLLGCKKWIA